MIDIEVAAIDAARMRSAGKDLLSLALMDARNRTLRWIGGYEAALGESLRMPPQPDADPPLWTLGHAGWFQEVWIGRNVQRQRGPRCDPRATRLASILPLADRWYDPDVVAPQARWPLALPDLQDTKQYLVATLETTLELLDGAADDDAGLHFYRLALFHEDLQAESLAMLAQSAGIDTGMPGAPAASSALREPLLFPATRWRLGTEPGQRGFCFDNEKWAHEVAVPEFEIDAQPVTWAQYAEFVEDGGYDERRHWSDEGWRWAEAQGRRVPRHVDQMRQGVLVRRGGRLTRVPLAQPAMHVSAHEAEAWCRWAGRRLPTEVEWEAAAHQGATRGFRWGDVWEWTAGTFRPYPGFEPDPYRGRSLPQFGTHRVLRGASFATGARLRHPKFRHYARPARDDLFSGFRSCAY